MKQQAPELGLYAETRAVANDRDRWRKMHERSDRSQALNIANRARKVFSLGGGIRVERGGLKREERV